MGSPTTLAPLSFSSDEGRVLCLGVCTYLTSPRYPIGRMTTSSKEFATTLDGVDLMVIMPVGSQSGPAKAGEGEAIMLVICPTKAYWLDGCATPFEFQHSIICNYQQQRHCQRLVLANDAFNVR
ncbi:unnamed protein product [Somion occarium]|uniref:Uncharacterized protein n=1 Tax=Somion occarium TaxID=3059160 RepID=A0ABP1CTH2_9APHY